MLNLLLDAFHNGLHAEQVVALIEDALSNFLNALTVQAIVELKRLHLVLVLTRCQTVLGVYEVELVFEM